MKKQFKRIICLTFAILFILFTPLGTFFQSKNARVYAATNEGVSAMMKFLIPIVGYQAYQIQEQNGTADLSKSAAQNIADNIAEMNSNANLIWNGLTINTRARILKYYTELSNYDINEALNTTFSDSEFGKYETEMVILTTKIANNEELSSEDLQGLGVYKILSNYLGQKALNPFKNDISNLSTVTVSGIPYVELAYYTNIHRSTNLVVNEDFIKLISIGYSYKLLSCESSTSGLYISMKPFYDITWKLSNSHTLKITTKNYAFEGLKDGSILYLSKDVINTGTQGFNFQIYNSSNVLVTSLFVNKATTLLTILNMIKPYLLVNIQNSDFYINSQNYHYYDLFNLGYLGTISYTPTQALVGNYPISDLIATVIDPDAGSFPDTNIGQAERVIAAEGTTTSDTNIAVEEDEVKGPTVIVTPSTGVADSWNPADEGAISDNPEGVFEPDGDGWIFRIPILGAILKALMDIFNLIKNWFTANPTTGSADPGGDWGNFKGFFDIFYIFYYLIILAIIILVKFFGVIISILDIPANPALFESYPTMLSGLNYLKNLKVGGFNITLQQIFEYMFTVFFFLCIVTQLQKLYHSFSGIERQQRRENEREARLESYNNERHYGYTNFTAANEKVFSNNVESHVGYSETNIFDDSIVNEDDYENLIFKDYTKDGD